MLLIVYVYDHNVPMPEYLKNTHERFLIFSEKKTAPIAGSQNFFSFAYCSYGGCTLSYH